ncbi:ankyrin [Morchella conica CCBAS932]|uniref:Ankyrin n=1 Tax=Morchella conica CCBAS932 TaxID=1392247 RepID=A0A3N4KFK3_9PEZI|nr:ankyrin [Morchella conica CCBAS932]
MPCSPPTHTGRLFGSIPFNGCSSKDYVYFSSHSLTAIKHLCRIMSLLSGILVDSCVGPSTTFWMYLACKAVSTIHGAWLCFLYMDHYDAAEKISREDSNTNIKSIKKTVYDSIPATAFSKYRESIVITLSSIVTIEVTLSGFDLPAANDISSWGQTGQILVALVASSCFTYGFYSMWKNKNVERRRKAIHQCSVGSQRPDLPVRPPCDDWFTWVKSLHLIVRDHHPFHFSQLRTTDHCRMESRGWEEIIYKYLRWEDETPDQLRLMLLDGAKLGDWNNVKDLIADGVDVNVVGSDGKTPLLIAVEGGGAGHLRVVKLLLQHGTVDVNVVDSDKNTPLLIAVEKNNLSLVELLLEHKARTSDQNRGGGYGTSCGGQRG